MKIYRKLNKVVKRVEKSMIAELCTKLLRKMVTKTYLVNDIVDRRFNLQTGTSFDLKYDMFNACCPHIPTSKPQPRTNNILKTFMAS